MQRYTENTLAQTELNQLLVIVQLYKAIGGGWEFKNDPQAATEQDSASSNKETIKH
jgi:outer membrane protein TolC